MTFAITPFFIGFFAVMQILLTGMVGYRRFQTRIPFFDGGDQALMRRMRAHGNFTETVPMGLLAMAAAELTGAPHWLLWSGGLVLVAGRLIHFATLLRSEWGIGRAIGIILTLISIGGFGLLAVIGMVALR